MEERLSLDFLSVVENAAIAAARTMGFGDRHKADEVAVEAMRTTMDEVEMDGTIVIGEGERDEAPMLYIGEKVGLHTRAPRVLFPAVDIAVDPLEGTNLCATGAPNAMAVLAASEKGGLLHAPDLYMEKIIVGPACKGAVELDAPVADNLRSVAKRLDRDVEDLVVIVLERPRHEELINDIRKAGARIRLIGDGDLSAGISAAVVGTGVHMVMGTGGAPEGVLTAAALRCLNGQILARLVVAKPEHQERLEKMGVNDPKRLYDTEDLAPGKKIIFACTGEDNCFAGSEVFGVVDAFGIVDAHFFEALLVFRLADDEAGKNLAVEAAEGSGGEDTFGSPARAHDHVNAGTDDGGGDSGGEVAVADQANTRAGFADVVDELFVARAVEDDDDKVLDIAVEPLGDRAQVVRDGSVEFDGAFASWPDDDFFHINIGSVE